jgi:hypothetical protein
MKAPLREHRTVSQLPRLFELEAMPLAEIRRVWTDLFGVSPPAVGNELLKLDVGYEMQRRVHGGLPSSQQRQLDLSAAALGRTGTRAFRDAVGLPPGTQLLREWHGKTYYVTVVADGFSFNGTLYPSLTRIARKITGCSWPGPAFFGLRSRKPQSGRASRDG